MTNPSPSLITNALWWAWEEARKSLPGVKLGGIYADKPGYHNTVNANKSKWPANYSIKVALDLKGPLDKARAIDLTLSTAEMTKRTGYLKSAVDRNDPRLFGVREFYGTLDGKTVFGRIKDSENGPWRSSTSDTSHLWHIHTSFFTYYCDSQLAVSGFISVLRGETLEQWLMSGGSGVFAKTGDKGESVKFIQLLGLRLGGQLPKFGADGDYGSETASMVASVFGGNGQQFGALELLNGLTKLAQLYGGQKGEKGDKGDKGDPGVGLEPGQRLEIRIEKVG